MEFSYRLLDNFIIRQIISLPFNTFFRADANIKTSMIHLRRKAEDEKQGNIFMAITNNIGHDDHQRDTPARNNLPIVFKFFEEWRTKGGINPQIIHNEDTDEPLGCPLQIFEVSPERLNQKRLDAFYYAPELRQAQEKLIVLEKEGKIVLRKGIDFKIIPTLKKDEIAQSTGKLFKYFEIGDVTIDGTIVKHRTDYFENLPTRARMNVQKNDIIFAKNNSSRGTTVLIPDWFEGGLVTTGFIGIRPRDYEEALILWSVLESEFFRKQIYYLAITASQPEVRENIFKNEMLVPFPKTDDDTRRIIENAKQVDNQRNNFKASLDKAKNIISELI